MYITNLSDVVVELRTRLNDYLVLRGVKAPDDRKFKCFVHADNNPSMMLNPKSNNETAHCFSCGATVDIFAAADKLESLATTGVDWVRETIPNLCTQLGISIALGVVSEADIERTKLYRLAQDISDYICHPNNVAVDYTAKRNWANNYEDCYTIAYEKIISHLSTLGWDKQYVIESKLITLGGEKNLYPIVDVDKVTFPIRDSRGRPIAFLSRNLEPSAYKYIHSAESLIFKKKEVLFGIDKAIKSAKTEGLYVVEGPGDRIQYLRINKPNVVALVGVALTESHLAFLKSASIDKLFLCLDWDAAGQASVEKILALVTKAKTTNVDIKICLPVDGYKDIDEFLIKPENSFTDLKWQDAFTYSMSKVDLSSEEEVEKKLISFIALVPTAIKRDKLAKELSDKIGVSVASILMDVDRIRNYSHEQRRDRLAASASKYKQTVETDPINILSALTSHEEEVNSIESEYGKQSIGVNYQLSKWDSLQEAKFSKDIDHSEFNLKVYKQFREVMSTGISWTSGAYMVVGGRSNSGKTTTIMSIGFDAVINDPDTILIIHLTDDAPRTVEPRLVTTASFVMHGNKVIDIGLASNPRKNLKTKEQTFYYNEALACVRGLLAEERLMVLDAEDGSTLSVLEKTIKYARRKHPNKKLFVVCDGVHNYSDFPGLDQTPRIRKIVDAQKRIAVKHACFLATTAEYKKNASPDVKKIRLPVNDDLADARELMFRADVIVHVYNDLSDRAADAEIFWIDPAKPDEPKPQLMLIFGKNKLTKFKGKLVMNLDTDTVTIEEEVLTTAARSVDNRQANGVTAGSVAVVDSEWEDND